MSPLPDSVLNWILIALLVVTIVILIYVVL